MRLTINLEEENYLIAKSLAKEADCSISKVVNGLVRKALHPQTPETDQDQGDSQDGLPIVKGDRVFSSEDVYQIENEALKLNEGTSS